MNHTVKIAPSMLSADFTKLADEIKNLETAGANYIHFDVMDGHFVPNLTFGAMVVKQLRPLTKLPFDVHLMVNNPQDYVTDFKAAGANILTFQYESYSHHDRLISLIKEQGMQVGIALNPSTSEDCLQYIIHKIDIITVMSVNPGFGGQIFLPEQLQKIKNIKQKYSNNNFLIEVDGGVSEKNAKNIIEAGADILVAGTAIFKNANYKNNINKLKE
ncbi:Ribulose-phosphate 3-epimerase [Candidatus Hepatincola sp. Pdp]